MTLAEVLNPRPIVPAEGSPHVRLVRLLADESDGRRHRDSAVSLRLSKKTVRPDERVGPATLNTCRRVLREDGPMTVLYLSAQASISRTQAQRAMRELFVSGEVGEIRINGVIPFVYYLKEALDEA